MVAIDQVNRSQGANPPGLAHDLAGALREKRLAIIQELQSILFCELDLPIHKEGIGKEIWDRVERLRRLEWGLE